MNELITSIIQQECGIFLRFQAGKVYWLKDHHKHLDPEDGQPVLIGESKPFKNARKSNRHDNSQIIYLHEVRKAYS